MLDILVIQSTPFCNINCSYCYLPDRSNSGKITLEILDATLTNLLSDKLINDTLSIVWHAGEPLAINITYFRNLLDFIRNKLPAVNVQHSIQTNGTLLSQEWCDLIVEFSIRIGVSIDGPQAIHDINRVTRNNKGTFESAMRGISLLQLNKIPYHAIAVVTKATLDIPEDFFMFFKANHFYSLGINIEEIEGINITSSLSEKSIEDNVRQFYSKLFDLYMASDGHMRIREFDRAFSSILRNPSVKDIKDAGLSTHQLEPLGIISVDYKGNFSTFSPELLGQQSSIYGDFILGNVLTKSFNESLMTEKYSTIDKDIRNGIDLCKKECEYFNLCGGGAPSNKLYENGSFNSAETLYCKFSIQQPIDIVLPFLENQFA